MFTSGAGICAMRKMPTADFVAEALLMSRIIAQLPFEKIWATRASDSPALVFVLLAARGTRFYRGSIPPSGLKCRCSQPTAPEKTSASKSVFLTRSTQFFLSGLPESSRVGVEDKLDLISYAAECALDFFFRSCDVGRVVEAPMIAVHLTWKHRAGLVGIAADGDDRIDGRV